MSSFVQRAGLPEQGKLLIIGEKYAEKLKKPLEKLGISILSVPDNPCVDERLSGHADLSVFHGGGKRLYLAPYLQGTGFHRWLEEWAAEPVFPAIEQGRLYPKDAQLNARAAGDTLFYAGGITAEEIVNIFTNKKGARLIDSRQGYAGCSVCAVDEDSVITSDPGIACNAEKNGLDVLRIAPGAIDLPGFSHGFIGGAAFRLSRDTLAFTGRLDGHPDREAILDFLDRKGFQAVFLTSESLFDIGGAIPLTEA